ncbi:MAG: NuoM family protein [Aaplasma endosymbiont of Hyalomma asiaticum]
MIPLMILTPFLGACLLFLFRGSAHSVRSGGVFISFTAAAWAISVMALVYFKAGVEVHGGVLSSAVAGVVFEVDALSMSMLVLSTFLFFLCALCGVLAASCRVEKNSESTFFSLLLLLEALVLGVFAVKTSMMFYVFFESSLIPMFFIIGFWGHGDKINAAFKFLIYTATASLFFLVAIVYSKVFSLGIFESFYEEVSVISSLPVGAKIALWAACFFAFAVKLPMVPWHTWLPKAHVQAPTLGSVLLAGLLIKMGGYGFLRFCVSAFPDVSTQLSEYVIYLSAVSLIYSSLVAYSQKNMKMLVAYSSVAHMSLVSAGIFSLNESGIVGAVFQMISHGLISAALFLCVGFIYSRTKTMEISKCGGLASSMPKLSTMMIFFSMASIGLPGTSGFVGEFLSMFGIFQEFGAIVMFFAAGVVLSAVYMLRLCREVVWGKRVYEESEICGDIGTFEMIVLGVLAVLVVFLGIFPMQLISFLKPWVSSLLPALHKFGCLGGGACT